MPSFVNLPLFNPKTTTGTLTSLWSLGQSKWWRDCQGGTRGVIIPLPCLPRTFIYLKLELNNGVLITRQQERLCLFTMDVLLHSQDRSSVSSPSLMNLNLVWAFIFHPLQIFYPWHCFLSAHKSMWWVLLSSFSWLFSIYYPTESIGFIILCCYCRCHHSLESALCWRKKKSAASG